MTDLSLHSNDTRITKLQYPSSMLKLHFKAFLATHGISEKNKNALTPFDPFLQAVKTMELIQNKKQVLFLVTKTIIEFPYLIFTPDIFLSIVSS